MGLICVSIRFGLYLMVVASSLLCNCNAVVPKLNYLIDCGSSTETKVGNRVFGADFYFSSNPSNSIFGRIKAFYVSSLDSSPLYETAQIFFVASTYSFIRLKQGRYFIRLYFYPFKYLGYDLTTAIFTVSTHDSVLLSNFQVPNISVAVFKEYSLNITAGFLNLTFTPVGSSSLSFVSAIELVLVPDGLIGDNVQILNLPVTYNGLSHETLETLYRINMGGSKIFPDHDPLGRTWITEENFLMNRNLAKFVNTSKAIKIVQGGANEETTPGLVYSTGTKLAASNISLSPFNVTWEFNVSPSSTFLIRLHFCDIISKKLNQLYFNVYINDFLGVKDLNLSVNGLAASYYTDFVVGDTDGYGKIRVSIGPSSMDNVLPDGILNGLEIMSIKFSSSNDHITTNSNSFSKMKPIIILSFLSGVFVVVMLMASLYIELKRRRKV